LRNSIPQSQIKDVSPQRGSQTMNRAERITPLSSNLGDQLRQLKNALRVLAEPEHKLRGQAILLREKVSSVWAIQAAQDKWFPWPNTIALPGAGELKEVCWRQQGMLDVLGYHVGETKPTPRDIRRCILQYAFECHLPPLSDRHYFLEWGKPQSARRLKKLSNTLAALTRNAKRRDVISYATAINDWEGDLALLHERYYVHFFHFGWPATDLLH
jgi:hypothetical protein